MVIITIQDEETEQIQEEYLIKTKDYIEIFKPNLIALAIEQVENSDPHWAYLLNEKFKTERGEK
jgi:hypothetical protein